MNHSIMSGDTCILHGQQITWQQQSELQCKKRKSVLHNQPWNVQMFSCYGCIWCRHSWKWIMEQQTESECQMLYFFFFPVQVINLNVSLLRTIFIYIISCTKFFWRDVIHLFTDHGLLLNKQTNKQNSQTKTIYQLSI